MDYSLRVIVYYRKLGKYALNVLCGAIDSGCGDIPVCFVKTEQELIDILSDAKEFQTNLVLWSFFSSQFDECSKQLQRIQSHSRHHTNIKHIAGGAHSSAEPEQVLMAGFDYAACGDGESLIVDLCRSLQKGITHPVIRGLCYKSSTGKIHKQGRGFLASLDDYPAGSEKHRKFGPIEITRGCIYACKFCQTPYMGKARFRHRSVAACTDFAEIMYRHGLRDYRFISPTSLSYGSQDTTVNHDAIECLLGTLRSRLGNDARIFFGSFPSEVRPEHVTHKTLKILKRYVNNDNLIIGAQSGSLSVLDSCRRGHGIDEVIQACKLSLQYDFKPNIDFLLGLPGESEKDRLLSLDLADKLADHGAKIHLHSFMPLPGTPYANAKPVKLDQTSIDRLNKLSSSGKAYGVWRKQAGLV